MKNNDKMWDIWWSWAAKSDWMDKFYYADGTVLSTDDENQVMCELPNLLIKAEKT